MLFFDVVHYWNWGLYYKTLRTGNVRQMDRFSNKAVPHIVVHNHTTFDKQTSLLQKL
jgi:hypothetical protein